LFVSIATKGKTTQVAQLYLCDVLLLGMKAKPHLFGLKFGTKKEVSIRYHEKWLCVSLHRYKAVLFDLLKADEFILMNKKGKAPSRA